MILLKNGRKVLESFDTVETCVLTATLWSLDRRNSDSYSMSVNKADDKTNQMIKLSTLFEI